MAQGEQDTRLSELVELVIENGPDALDEEAFRMLLNAPMVFERESGRRPASRSCALSGYGR